MADRAARLALAALALTSVACVRGCTSSQPPIHINPSMDNQPKLRAQSESGFFYDGAGMRPLVPGTIARGELREDTALYAGTDAAGQPVATSPIAVDEKVLARGEERYRIYCQPCHDPRGDGKGILFQRGNVPTPSLHSDKVRTAPDGFVYGVITNGSGLMPAYKWPIPPEDRWAIVAHLRALQQQRIAEGGAPVAAAPAPAPADAGTATASPAPAEPSPAAPAAPAPSPAGGTTP
jgi:mono/diheme cytochrome c family protein